MMTASLAHADEGFNAATFDDPKFNERIEDYRGRLLVVLLQQANPAAIPFLTARLDQEPDRVRQQTELGLLAACGPRAVPLLDKFYDRLTVKRLKPAAGPYVLPPCYENWAGWVQGKQVNGERPVAVLSDGTRVTAFMGDGLVNPGEVYLAINAANDDTFTESVPTGITHAGFNYRETISASNPFPALPTLRADGNTLTLGYNELSIQASGSATEREVLRPRTASFTLAELRKRSGPGGLTALEAKLLLVSGSDAGDADGDGLPDVLDPSPSTPGSDSTVQQRAVLRALDYVFRVGQAAIERAAAKQQPACQSFEALYLEPEGDVPAVQFSPAPDTYGIWLDSAERKAAYKQLLTPHVRAGWVFIRMRPADFRPNPKTYDSTDEAKMFYRGFADLEIDANWPVMLRKLGDEYYPVGLLHPMELE